MVKKRYFCFLFSLILCLSACSFNNQPIEQDNSEDSDSVKTIVDTSTGEEVVIDSGGTIRVSMGNPETLNPLLNRDLRVDRVLGLIFQPLFSLDSEQNLVPVLAQEYILSADGKTMSIVLKSGLTWDDGQPITAEDIIYSLQTIKNSAVDTVYKPALANVASCYQSSELVAVINYSEPYGGCAYNLCFPLIPRHYYRNGDKDFSPLGNGCYKMVEYRERNSMKLVATNAANKGMPYIRNIDVIFTPDSETELHSFQRNLTDVLVTDLNNMGRFDLSNNISVTPFNSNQFEFIGFNFNQPVLANNSFRQGIAYALPLQDIINNIYVGNANKSITPINTASTLSAGAGIESYEYNPEFAHNMLAATGYDMSKLTLSLLVNNDNTERLRVATLVADALEEMGMTVEIEAVDFNTYLSRLQKRDFQLYIGGAELNQRIELSPLIATGGSINYGGYSDAHMNELINACKNALGDDNYKKAVKNLQAYCAKELPCIGIGFKASVLLTNGNIKGNKEPALNDTYANIEQWYISNDK